MSGRVGKVYDALDRSNLRNAERFAWEAFSAHSKAICLIIQLINGDVSDPLVSWLAAATLLYCRIKLRCSTP